MEVLGLKVKITKIKKLNKFNSKLEGTEKRLSELEDRTMEITHSEIQEESRLGQINKAPGTYETTRKDATF